MIQNYLEHMKKIEEGLLDYFDCENNFEENTQNLIKIFEDTKISDDPYEFQSLLYLLLKIGNYHFRGPNFFTKIEQILRYFKEDIKKKFSNFEIFNIFKSNKRILLFLIEEQIMVINENIVRIIAETNKYRYAQYRKYFQPEIKDEWFTKYFLLIKKEELPENFIENRKIGENESKICQLIRKDLVKEFIVFVNQNNIPLYSEIEESIYETNSNLIKIQTSSLKYSSLGNYHNRNKIEKLTLIKYAAFFGSLEIFNYLRLNGVELEPSICAFAIHGKNAEIIHILEENYIISDNSYMKCFLDSIKCNHNDIAFYFLTNFLQNDVIKSKNTFNQSLKYYNFAFMSIEQINESSFFNLCKYNYCFPVNFLLQNQNIDLNIKYNSIFNVNLLNNVFNKYLNGILIEICINCI